jgi:hypothetical protein
MASLKIPDEVFRRVEERARKHGLSVDEQAAQDLARLAAEELDETALLDAIRQARGARGGQPLLEHDLQLIKRKGRA